MAAHGAVDVHDLAVRKTSCGRIDASQVASGHTGFGCKPAVHVHITEVRSVIANLRVVAGIERVQFAVLEETRAVTPHKIDVAGNITIRGKKRTRVEQRVLETTQIDSIQDTTLATATECLGL